MLFQLQILYSVKWESTDPSGREFAPPRLLGLRVRILLGPWMSVSCGCCLLTGGGVCVRSCSSHEKVGKWLLNQIGRICRYTAATPLQFPSHSLLKCTNDPTDKKV